MPTIPGNVVRTSIVWALPGFSASEIAVNTFHLQNQAGPSAPAPDPQYIADQVAAKLTAAWSGMSAIFPANVHVTAIKTYLLDTTGHATAAGAHNFASTDLLGTASSGSMPPEVAICLSLSSYPKGGFTTHKGRKRGRLYLGPVAQGTCTSAGRVVSGTCDDIITGWKAFFEAVNTIESASGRTDPMGLVVLSTVGNATYEVGYLWVDDHFDAQRRRQHQDTPNVHTGTVAAWV